jgi:hypothetical protein
MRTGVKASTSSSESTRRYHNLLYIPSGSGSTHLTPIEYIIYPIGLRKVSIVEEKRFVDDELNGLESICLPPSLSRVKYVD